MFRSHGDIERPTASAEAPKESNLYKCDFCSEGWESETDVQIHRTRAHQNEIQKLLLQEKPVCLICLTKYQDRSSLLRHTNTEHLLSSEEARRIEREIFICDYCCQIFFNKRMLVVHLAQVHKMARGRSLVECPKCVRSLRIDTMWSHFQFHQIQSVCCCPICFTKCLDREDFRRHVSAHARHYQCDACMFATSKAGAFHEHADRHRAGRGGAARRACTDPRRFERFFVPRAQETWRYRKMSAFKGLTMPSNIRICIMCREICTCKKEMRHHILNHSLAQSEEKKKYVCACGEVFFNRILLKQHTFKLKGSHKAVD